MKNKDFRGVKAPFKNVVEFYSTKTIGNKIGLTPAFLQNLILGLMKI